MVLRLWAHPFLSIQCGYGPQNFTEFVIFDFSCQFHNSNTIWRVLDTLKYCYVHWTVTINFFFKHVKFRFNRFSLFMHFPQVVLGHWNNIHTRTCFNFTLPFIQIKWSFHHYFCCAIILWSLVYTVCGKDIDFSVLATGFSGRIQMNVKEPKGNCK